MLRPDFSLYLKFVTPQGSARVCGASTNAMYFLRLYFWIILLRNWNVKHLRCLGPYIAVGEAPASLVFGHVLPLRLICNIFVC